MELVKQDYYSVGSVDDIVISNSSLGAIDPTAGGSPQKFLEFFQEDVDRKTSIQMDRGSLLHLWHEDSKRPGDEKQFIIADIEKPSEMMSSWCERIYSMIASSGVSQESCADEVIHATRQGAYKNIVDSKTLIAKFRKEGEAYFNHLVKADGKIAISPETRRILEGQTQALLGHERANIVLFGAMPENAERFIEEEVYWSADVNVSTNPEEEKLLKVKFKAKLDNVVIRWDKKIIYLNDLKTTGKPVSLFKRSFISFRYYRQLAFYSDALMEFLISKGISPTEIPEWKVIARIVAIDSTKFFNVGVFNIDAKWHEKGTQEHRGLTERVIWHIATDEWTKTPEENQNNGELQITFDEKDEILNSILID